MGTAPHLRRPDDSELRRKWDTVGENELRLPQKAAEEVVAALNRDLSGLYILFNQLRKHYWTAEGAEVRPVADMLKGHADRLAEATDDLAIRVHALGGVPVNGPMGIRQHAPLDIEAGDRYDLRSSLAHDLEGYAQLAVNRREHIERAAAVGDEATVELLRSHLKTLEEDAQELGNTLAADTLVRFDAE